MKLYKYFTLEEMTLSQTAVRNNIDNTPSASEIENLKHLCQDILDPLCDKYNLNIYVSSGYRCKALNDRIGGAKTSQHIKGQAADINAEGMTANELYELIKSYDIAVDQCIMEFNRWAHISWAEIPRGQNLIASKNEQGKTVYKSDFT